MNRYENYVQIAAIALKEDLENYGKDEGDKRTIDEVLTDSVLLSLTDALITELHYLVDNP